MKLIYFTVLLFFSSSALLAQTVSGIVDDQTGATLIGASVQVKGTSIGAVTDIDGAFELSYDGGFPFIIEVSYTGYTSQEIEITAPMNSLRITLAEGVLIGQEVIISASRRAEKLQDAPAAVSVISAKEVSSSGGAIAPIRALINTPGVELQQQTG